MYLHAGTLDDIAVAGGPQHLSGAAEFIFELLPHRLLLLLLLLRSRAMKRKRLLPMAVADGAAPR